MNFRRCISVGLLPLCFIWLSVIEKNISPLILLLHIAVHEAGHLVAAIICHSHPSHAEGRYIGMNITFSGNVMSYKNELFILLSGSMANFLFLFASLFVLPKFYEFYYLSGIGIALFNLLPLRICDGGKALSCLLFMLFSEKEAHIVSKTVYFIFTLLLLIFAISAQFVYSVNLSVLIISIYVFIELILT